MQIRFVGTVGKRFESDIAIDDIALLPGPCTAKESEKGKIIFMFRVFLATSKCGHVCRGIAWHSPSILEIPVNPPASLLEQFRNFFSCDKNT